MRNLVFVAALATIGYNMVSCDTDSVDSVINESASKVNLNQVSNMMLRETDTISINDTLTTNQLTEPGPGDDVVPIKPPKP
ncbi:hypothetical protein [Flavobacterium terrae]|uniref:Uncharacterized protein n=1 Tax=Flavobacterium terrae TaxID=415425 RepID=A0A1M6G0K9_9FLAO|nr:hypothetical protein [Flavobacterium terrae]SHJ03439.1 hypothetical protein SAMN05444363_2447 [Flavobacterium terrae]